MPNDISTRRFDPGDTDAVRSLIKRAAADGELVGFNRSEVRGWLNYVPDDGDRTLVAVRNGAVIGFLSYAADGLIVAPEHRRLGAGRALVAAALEARPELEISQWSGSPETAAFLESVGFRLHHHLLRLLRTGSTRPPAPVIADGFRLIGYQADAFDPYVTLVRDSFADHPTPLHVEPERIRSAHEKPEFDPNSIRMIAIEGDAHRPVAFVRLKSEESETGAPRGSIAMLGVLPAYRGRGFARQLLRWGVTSFIDQGIDEIELEVVTNNDRALPLYTGEGFVQAHAWPYWMPAPPRSS